MITPCPLWFLLSHFFKLILHFSDAICKGLIANSIPNSLDHQGKGKGSPLLKIDMYPPVFFHASQGSFEALDLKLIG
jgi:hypothetical protein